LFTPSFYLGNATEFISGSNSKIQIKSTAFELDSGTTLHVRSTDGGLMSLGGSGDSYDLSAIAFSGSGIGKIGTINLRGTDGTIFIGTGTYNNSNTSFYLSGSGAGTRFSLGSQLT
jgi:hypothetical protein